MGHKSDAKRLAKEKAKPVLNLIDSIAGQLNEVETRGFLQKIHRAVYERRKPLYRHGLHPHQKR
jgi:hypothetical protein